MSISTIDISEVLQGLQRGNDAAAYEFVRRQPTAAIPALASGLKVLIAEVWNQQWKNADVMMRWKEPETLPPLPEDLVRPVLSSAVSGDADTVRFSLGRLSLEELSVASTLFYRLRQHVWLRERGQMVDAVDDDSHTHLFGHTGF